MNGDKQANPLGLILVAGLGLLLVANAQPSKPPTPTSTSPAVVLGTDATAKLAAVREIAKRDAVAARRLGLLLGAAGDMIRSDAESITTTEQLFRFVERAERFNTTADGMGKLPGIGASVSDVLKSPDVLGTKVAPLDAVKRKASADALKVVSETLRGG